MENNGSSLELASLYKEIEVTRIMYEQEYKNYFKIVGEDNHNFVVLEGNTFWGTSGLSEGSVNTVEECKAMCSKDTKCSGATFKAKSKYCWTRTGHGELMASSSKSDYAIITEIYQSASKLYSLSHKMINLVEKVQKINSENFKKYQTIDTEAVVNNNILNKKYQILVAQNKEIQEILQKYKTIDEAKLNTTLKVNQHSLYYNIGIFSFIILLYIGAKIIFNLPGNFITVLYLAFCLFAYILNMEIISITLLTVFFFYEILAS